MKFKASIVSLVLLVSGCAPQPTTRINLATGEYESPKDIKAKLITVDADGKGKRKVEIHDLDSSASSVIAAQAEAMKAQSDAFKAVGDAMSNLVERVSPISAPK